MFFEYISKTIGLLRLCIYKLFYPSRISFKGIPQVSKNINILTKKGAKIIIGKGFKCRNGVSIRADKGGHIIIGDNVFLNERTSIYCRKKITIGSETIIGPGVMFFDHDHDYRNNINKFIDNEIIIGNKNWIGANVTILKGTLTGDNTIIGADTIINSKIENNVLVYQKRTTTKEKYK